MSWCRLLHGPRPKWVIVTIRAQILTGPDQPDHKGSAGVGAGPELAAAPPSCPFAPRRDVPEPDLFTLAPCETGRAGRHDSLPASSPPQLPRDDLLVLASFLAFCLASLTFHPLDSFIERHPQPPAEAIHAKAVELGLDKPVPIRYAEWAAGVVRGRLRHHSDRSPRSPRSCGPRGRGQCFRLVG